MPRNCRTASTQLYEFTPGSDNIHITFNLRPKLRKLGLSIARVGFNNMLRLAEISLNLHSKTVRQLEIDLLDTQVFCIRFCDLFYLGG